MTEIDPDRPVEGDPPINALSMLEVAEEAHAHAARMREAAVEVKRRYALRAILDGHNPRQVAEACGFDLTPRPQQQYPPIMEMMFGRNVTFEDESVFTQDGSEADRFAHWAAQQLFEMVKENWR